MHGKVTPYVVDIFCDISCPHPGDDTSYGVTPGTDDLPSKVIFAPHAEQLRHGFCRNTNTNQFPRSSSINSIFLRSPMPNLVASDGKLGISSSRFRRVCLLFIFPTAFHLFLDPRVGFFEANR